MHSCLVEKDENDGSHSQRGEDNWVASQAKGVAITCNARRPPTGGKLQGVLSPVFGGRVT